MSPAAVAGIPGVKIALGAVCSPGHDHPPRPGTADALAYGDAPLTPDGLVLVCLFCGQALKARPDWTLYPLTPDEVAALDQVTRDQLDAVRRVVRTVTP